MSGVEGEIVEGKDKFCELEEESSGWLGVGRALVQTTSVTSLKLHTNLSSNPDTSPVSTSVNPPHSTLASAALKVSLQFPVFYC